VHPTRRSVARTEKIFWLHQQQEGKCAICKEPMERPNLDHNHKTGKIRGLLCPRCNLGLGFYETWYKTHRKSVWRYLSRHK
jgi:Recombination endonuclease VII